MFFKPSSQDRDKIGNMGLPKARDYTKIKIKMPNPNQGLPVSSKAPNQDFKDMDVLCICKINIENQHLEQGTPKDH